ADEYAAEDTGGGYHFRHFLKYKNGNENNILDLHNIVGVVNEPDKFHRGLASYHNSANGTPNFRGLINLDYNIDHFAVGSKAAKDLLDNHIIISIDFGILSELSAVFIDGKFSSEGTLEGRFTKLQFSNGAKYQNSGYLKFTGDYASINEKSLEHCTALSSATKRTNDVFEYERFCDLYKVH
ncbi:hypothetical protein MP638_006437, partial [Amoeboaphelidium occidentale]